MKTNDELINELIESPDGDRWTLAATVVQQRATIAALRDALESVVEIWNDADDEDSIRRVSSYRSRFEAAAALLSPTPAGHPGNKAGAGATGEEGGSNGR